VSIYAYVGRPGSGKSYNLVANVILPALRDGRRLVTNVPLYRDVIMAAEGVTGQLVDFPIMEIEQDPELIMKYVRGGDVLVIDEVWKLWPNGQKTADIPNVYKTLLAEHRHMTDDQGRSIHICLAVQDLGSVAVFARRLVEQTYIHSKMTDLNMDGRYRVDIYAGAVTGFMGSDKLFIRSVYGEYSQEVWKFYQSHTKSSVGGGVHGEKAIDRRGNRFRRPFFALMVPLALVGVVFVGLRLKHRSDEIMHPVRKEVPHVETHPGFVAAPDKPANLPVFGPLSRAGRPGAGYRVVGYIEVPGDPARSKALLVSDTGQKITRTMTHCRFIDGDYFECNIDGQWYGSAGRSLAEDDTRPVPVAVPRGAPANMPISESPADAEASVASAAPPLTSSANDPGLHAHVARIAR
jgi:zona occludens toxin